MPTSYNQLSEHIYIYYGNINVGILKDNNRALLFDFGDGAVSEILDLIEIDEIDMILFTHHHRDQASGIKKISSSDIRLGVPVQEIQWFQDVESFWNNPEKRWHIYDIHPHTLMLSESVKNFEVTPYKGGDNIKWGQASISVMDTHGHTDGSVSYFVEVDGKKIVFSGDVIYDKGQIWELYSLQKGETTSDYHGFLGSRKELKSSLNKIRSMKPDMLIPSHGRIMNRPKEAVDLLIKRLDECYDKYVAISALRYYFPEMFAKFQDREGHMPIRKGKPNPEFLRHFGTSWVIISESGNAFVLDCGGQNVIKQLQEMQKSGEIEDIDGLWITHYHDDHVDAIPNFKKVFGCPVYADSSVAMIVENPRGFRYPCISPSVIDIDNVTRDGESWNWEEFKFTAYHFPGQTYYHGGLLVEGNDLKLFFAGDSFTMSGIDDYCSGNRNWLGENTGFDRCLKLMQELKPTHIFNCHVDTAFDFTQEELDFIRKNLSYREKIYGDLFPWDSPNYGMDEYWIRCYPYDQDTEAGKNVELSAKVYNHSERKKSIVCKPELPKGWEEVAEKSTQVKPRTEGSLTFNINVPKNLDKSILVIPFHIIYDGRNLGQFRESMLFIK
ncbi:MBL fold metallo-hydrolase [Candidatus Poribacteria bacterium]|nr:MBL fold metallo-hydrolase [Candidatus Poribacteria bacterium]